VTHLLRGVKAQWIAMLLAAALAAPAMAQKGRFEVDLGLVDIERVGYREVQLPPLPDADIAFGFSLSAPDGEKVHHLPKATVRITLMNERDEVVFDVSDELSNFTRAESTRATFLYLRGVQNQAPGPDGGWGTYAHPRKGGRYRMTVETLKSNVTMTKFVVRLMGVDGRWK
jgi:hypothetical protein